MKYLILGIWIALLLSIMNVESTRMVGYYGLEIGYANQSGCPQILTPDRVPAELYTHLIFSFASIGPDQTILDPANGTLPLLLEFQNLKQRNSNLALMVSLGGWSMNMSLYSQSVMTEEGRTTLVKNIMTYLRKWNWDGIDFDWEYPTAPDRGGQPQDPENYVAFIRLMRQAVESELVPSGKSKLIMSMALPGGPYYGQYYHMSDMLPNLDFANIMAYNLHGPWEPVVYCSADFYDGTPADSPYHGYSINDAIQYFLTQNGSSNPPEKFNLGVTFAGVEFTISNPNQITPGSAAVGEGNGGLCTREPGYMAYFEVVSVLNETNITPQFDSVGYCKYFVYDTNQWVGYDDAETLAEKVGLVEKIGLGGISVWAMYAESATGNVLQNSIHNALFNGETTNNGHSNGASLTTSIFSSTIGSTSSSSAYSFTFSIVMMLISSFFLV